MNYASAFDFALAITFLGLCIGISGTDNSAAAILAVVAGLFAFIGFCGLIKKDRL